VIITKLRGRILNPKTGTRLRIANAGRLGWDALPAALAAGKFGLLAPVTDLKIRTLPVFPAYLRISIDALVRDALVTFRVPLRSRKSAGSPQGRFRSREMRGPGAVTEGTQQL